MAFVIAPLVPAIVAIILPTFVGIFLPIKDERWFNLEAVQSAPLLYSVSAIAEVVLGLPAFFLGKWLGLIRWWSASVVGFVIGDLMMLYLQGGMMPAYLPSREVYGFFALSGVPGALSGLAFWLIWSLGHRE
jgi:hypothetical protein